ncbi:MAG: poly-beta-1,6-N-acetyl-D-glucosamine biosynthesis protein PgaD [Lentisphaerae bacterium GWF2_44_16]|nr:MAG: poly-beta-1,6-N-acetyl-D-glucosamine biosynthesis protein PgaD [Lentisphaerae bacterium GWF2_44_16]
MTEKAPRIKINIETGEGLIIERTDIFSKVRQYSSWTYNVAAWAIWLMLMRPLIVIFLWYLGFKIARFQMIELEGFRNLHFFMYALLAVSCIFLAMLTWNRYNVFLFRGKERRKPLPDCTDADFAAYYKITQSDVEILKNSNVDIYFSEDETIIFGCGENKNIKALYAPLLLEKHFAPVVNTQLSEKE